jgi:hypothetical protein
MLRSMQLLQRGGEVIGAMRMLNQNRVQVHAQMKLAPPEVIDLNEIKFSEISHSLRNRLKEL